MLLPSVMASTLIIVAHCDAVGRGHPSHQQSPTSGWSNTSCNNSIEEAQHFATKWLWTYSNDGPSMGVGGLTPAMKLKMAA